ncbi:MAG: adenylosuccinate lyase [Phycisphaerae bacterium]|nr:adenylosuccinate lyase [Phycisphaerae bacterium]
MPDRNTYTSPLETRYAGKEMRTLFGDQKKFSTWRRLWLELARCQKELGLDITDEQIAQMEANLDNINFAAASHHERRLRHDVMAHIHTFGDAAPAARPIIHLGATSQYVNDNTDLIVMREGMRLLIGQLANIAATLADFARKQRDTVCLAFTHFQPAQLTTVGKRATLWCQDFLMDLRELEHRLETLEFRGVKGTTGTQASFLALFDGDHEKVKRLDRTVAQRFGFARVCPVTGQTYSRKIDAAIAAALGGIGASVHKFCNDIRLLSHCREIEEPFGSSQVGSSAMAYKRNPMRCERATGLARWLIGISAQPLQTAAEQWFERTLDDSANKRLAIPEAFLTADACLRIVLNVAQGLVVHPNIIAQNFVAELPYMATENILMAAVRAGGDRQKLHERIRVHSLASAEQVNWGHPNDLLDRLQNDDAFDRVDFNAVLEPRAYIGRSPEQVDEFLTGEIAPILEKYAGKLGQQSELNV